MEDQRSLLGEERRRREAAEREASDLRKRLKLANDEIRIWREKCELMEEDLTELRATASSEPRHQNLFGAAGFEAFDAGISNENFEEPLYEAELSAIEGALNEIYVSRATLTGDLEQMRRQMLATLEFGMGSTGEVVPGIGGMPSPPAASPRGPVPPAMSPRATANSASGAVRNQAGGQAPLSRIAMPLKLP
jgi:hypothetical protein